MKDIQVLFAEADRYKSKRAALAAKLKAADEQYRTGVEKLEKGHRSRLENLEKERKGGIAALESAAKKEIASYTKTKNELYAYANPVRPWCSQDKLRSYIPNPGRVNEAELETLIRMVQEQGIIAWIKRTFRLGGYSSREEMALELCQRIEDACAYCNERIMEAESRCSNSSAGQATDYRRKVDQENQRFQTQREDLESKRRSDRELATEAIRRFDAAAELQRLHSQIRKMHAAAVDSCGQWGEYTSPETMPEKVLMCDVKLSLPNNHGVDETLAVPLWLNLFTTNVVVVTSDGGSATGVDGPEKVFVRKLLARMLKTIPPEKCSYSIFDSLHKGASLERLIDVTNAGATNMSFDLFTNEENDGKTVTCAERRKYLRSRPAEIIKSMAGRSKSLFEHNRKTGKFEFPFTWVVDFNFPSDPDERFLNDMKDLLVNAKAAGYSFVFVTSEAGLEKIRELVKTYTETQVIHVDCGKMVCRQGDICVPFTHEGIPQKDQIYNFMTALNQYYTTDGVVDNRLNSVFASKGIVMRDASAKLTIPMALDSRCELVDLTLGGEGSVHGFVSGGTNSGKSTLLHTIILSACLHYHPEDLEIWLADYKQTEFHLYKRRTPPHIKLIGLSKTPDFTFSLLDRIEEEANRRTALMNQFDAQNMVDYRKHRGEPGYVHFPRLFIVIDEFHEMSQFVAGEREYQVKLENTLREYRAQGITCLLADQTFSTGLSGLTTAAKNQIGLRIAMRNEASPQEIKNTLEVDRALYSDTMQHTMSVMSQGEFIMKIYLRDNQGVIKDIRLEKFKALYAKGEDIIPIGKALRIRYKGQFKKDLVYVNTRERVYWSDDEPALLDQKEPLRYPNIRFYLGRPATLRPCFGLDMGRQPNENLSIVGGEARQRWELLASIIRSCRFRQYKLVVFMAEYSDLMCDHAQEIRNLCASVPGAELVEEIEDWCVKLKELKQAMADRKNAGDTVCVFIGLEIAAIEFGRLPEEGGGSSNASASIFGQLGRYGVVVPDAAEPAQTEQTGAFNAMPIIDKLFSDGARSGIRCVAEVSVYRQFAKLLKLKEMCRHKVAFSMSADDCLSYMGNSNYQKSIEQNAIYNDGGKEVKKLIPYLYRESEV